MRLRLAALRKMTLRSGAQRHIIVSHHYGLMLMVIIAHGGLVTCLYPYVVAFVWMALTASSSASDGFDTDRELVLLLESYRSSAAFIISLRAVNQRHEMNNMPKMKQTVMLTGRLTLSSIVARTLTRSLVCLFSYVSNDLRTTLLFNATD